MKEPVAFVVEGADGFVVDGQTGWLAFIAGYARIATPPREVEGFPVLEPVDMEVSQLRRLVEPGVMWPISTQTALPSPTSRPDSLSREGTK